MSAEAEGFGVCACGTEAIVRLNGVACCLDCFRAGLARLPSPRSLLDQLRGLGLTRRKPQP